MRAVVTGALLVALISVASPWAVLVVKGSQLTSNAIPIIAVFLLFAVTALAQPLLRLLSRQLAFRRADESADERFYAVPRLVTHIDEAAVAAVTDLYRAP